MKSKEKKKVPKGCIFGCLSIIFLAIIAGVLGAVNNSNGDEIKNVKTILDVEQFSLENQAFVKEKLGEPQSFDDVNYQTPSTGVNNVLTYYYYDWQGYYSEFIFDNKDRLIRINIYTNDNKDSEFTKTTFDDHLKQLGITPDKRMTKTADTGYAWRYQSVTDKIDEVWSMGDEKDFDAIKISFDVRPFM